jgi:plasmid stability protein
MAQVVIRKIDDDAMTRLKARARRKGVSLEQELRTILIETARLDEAGFRGRAAAFRRKLSGRRHSDSTRLIREDRDR